MVPGRSWFPESAPDDRKASFGYFATHRFVWVTGMIRLVGIQPSRLSTSPHECLETPFAQIGSVQTVGLPGRPSTFLPAIVGEIPQSRTTLFLIVRQTQLLGDLIS